MDHQFCPGAKTLRQPEPEMFSCPACGEEVEIWTDEMSRHCTQCGTKVMKDSVMSCLEWCAMGEECVGTDAYNNFLHAKNQTIREMILEALKKEIGEDHLAQAERLELIARGISSDRGADWHLLMPAALLHVIRDRTERVSTLLFRTGMKLEHIEAIQLLLSGDADPESINVQVLKESLKIVSEKG